jgi:hypothetical protein
MGDGIFGGTEYAHQGVVNQKGEKFTEDLYNQWVKEGEKFAGPDKGFTRNPARTKYMNDMFFNWLTGGGLPKQIDPGKIFSESQALAPLKERAGAGQGIAGLFGFGSLIGDLGPKLINQSPMQTGVPYSVPPVPMLFGSK